MKLVLDDIFDLGLKDYLLSQNGICDVTILAKDFISEIYITYNDEVTPTIILKYIELYQNEQSPIMLSFDKIVDLKSRQIQYKIDDMCCEYCYKGLVTDLFKNEKIKSVKSNFDLYTPAINIEFFIEYDEDYDEQKLINYIKEKIGI